MISFSKGYLRGLVYIMYYIPPSWCFVLIKSMTSSVHFKYERICHLGTVRVLDSVRNICYLSYGNYVIVSKIISKGEVSSRSHTYVKIQAGNS